MKKITVMIAAVVLICSSPSITLANEIEIAHNENIVSSTEITSSNITTDDGGLTEQFYSEVTIHEEGNPSSVSPTVELQLTEDSAFLEQLPNNDTNSDSIGEKDPVESIIGNEEDLSIEASAQSSHLQTELENPNKEDVTFEADSNVDIEVKTNQEEVETVVKVEKENKSFLSINLLGLNINLLDGQSLITLSTKKQNGKGGLLSLNIADKLEVGLLSSKTSDESSESKGSLLNIGIKNSKLLGNTTVELLSDKKQQQNGFGSLLNVNIENSVLLKPITGNINLLLLSSIKEQNEKYKNFKQGLLNLNVDQSLLLGKLNLGVVSSKGEKNDEESKSSKGLLQLLLNNKLLGNNYVGLLAMNKQVKGDTTVTESGIVVIDHLSTVGGDIHLGVGEVKEYVSPTLTKIEAGLVKADFHHPSLGNNHLGILETTITKTPESKTISGGIVIIDSNDNHIGIGEFEKKENNKSANDNKNDDNSNNNQNSPTITNDDDNEKETPGNESTTENDTQHTIPSEVVQDTPSVSYIIPEEETVFELEQLQHDSVGQLLHELLDNGKKMITNGADSSQRLTNQSNDLLKQMKNKNKQLPTPKEIAPTQTQNHSNSSSSSSTSNMSSGYSQVAAYISNEIVKLEMEKSRLKWIDIALRDQWLQPPPWKPPIQHSFFSN